MATGNYSYDYWSQDPYGHAFTSSSTDRDLEAYRRIIREEEERSRIREREERRLRYLTNPFITREQVIDKFGISSALLGDNFPCLDNYPINGISTTNAKIEAEKPKKVLSSKIKAMRSAYFRNRKLNT